MTTFYTNYINYTAQSNAFGYLHNSFTAPLTSNYIVIFMTSLWIRGSSGSPLQFHIYPEVVNSTHYCWNLTLWRNTLVTNVHFSEIIFNSDDIQASKTYYVAYRKW